PECPGRHGQIQAACCPRQASGGVGTTTRSARSDVTMDDDLIAYLLEALPPDARQRVEARLPDDAAAPSRLERFRSVLTPLAEDAAVDEPPPSLVLSTLGKVAEHKCKLPYAPAPACSPAGPAWSGFRRADLLVAASILIVVGGLLFPLLAGLWGSSGR